MRSRSSRWPALGGVLLILGAGVAAQIPTAPPAGPGRLGGRAFRGPDDPRATTSARAQLAQARATHGAGSARAADAIDTFVLAVAAGGNPGDLPEARKLARESVAIREKLCTTECPSLARSLTSFETLLWRFEDYRAALPLAQRALAIQTRTSGPRSPEVAGSTYLLAEVHRALGNYALAEKLHWEAISIWKEAPGAHPLDIANSLHYLGLVRWRIGDSRAAQDYIERALEIRERTLGAESESLAADFNTLGNLAAAGGDAGAAMTWFEKGQAIWEKTRGKSHPHVARSLSNRAGLLAASGDDSAARELYRRALQIRLDAFGPEHYLVARSLADLGRLDTRVRLTSEADQHLRRALEIYRKDPRTPPGEMASTMVDAARLSLLAGDAGAAIDLALQAESVARHDFLQTSSDLGEEDALRYEWIRGTGLDVALAALAAEPAGSLSLSHDASRAWEEVIRSRAMVLDQMASRLRASTSPSGRPVGLEEVAQHLPPEAALIGFVRYSTPDWDGRDTDSYVALVLGPGAGVIVRPLGDAEGIEAAVREWRKQTGTEPRLSSSRSESERRFLEAGQRLRRAVWDPLEPALKGKQIVFVVPDGALGFVSFATLPDEKGRYLIETGPGIHYLSAERDLLLPHRVSEPGAGLLALGDAEFEAFPDRADESGPGIFHGAAAGCPAFGTLRFDSLPGSRREVEDVASLWSRTSDVLELTGAAATEAAFKRSAPGRRILHLATHGFFLQDRCPSSLGGGRTPGGEGRVGENPLRLSGLALAGANRRAEASEGKEDGILTAEEIGALDLSRTEWAVLSACETGMGQVLDGEGVLGLRRAFQVAGVATQIMTLWPIDDGAARVWTHHLYEGRLRGLSTASAVRQASLRMIASQRSLGRSTHPYYWGAFVATGDWR